MDLSQLSKDELVMLILKLADKSLLKDDELVADFESSRKELQIRKLEQAKKWISNNLPEEYKKTVEKIQKIGNGRGRVVLYFEDCCITIGFNYVMLFKGKNPYKHMLAESWEGPDREMLTTDYVPEKHEKYFRLGKILLSLEDGILSVITLYVNGETLFVKDFDPTTFAFPEDEDEWFSDEE